MRLRLRISLLISGLIGALLSTVMRVPALSAAISNDKSVIVDATTRFQTIEGGGTSFACWANVIGG